MKVSIGSKIVLGPWGGGNLFAINLSTFLKRNGHEVIYDLSDPDIDLILLTDPRSRRESSSTFNHYDIDQYKKYVKPNVKVVQRINECDERKNTNNINEFYLNASNTADHVVFVSSWLQNIYHDIGLKKEKSSVILAGANSSIFNSKNLDQWKPEKPMKVVTHHWSSHENKGFDDYQKLDDLLVTPNWKGKIEFTYIGNMNDNYNFINSKTIKPLAGDELAKELKKNHLYITGSINEPSGNHHIEAAQCGLPILYKNSGGVPEYCKGFGVAYDNDLEQSLEIIYKNYNKYAQKLSNYPFNAEKMCRDFLSLFEKLLHQEIESQTKNYFIMKNYVIFKNRYSSLIRGFSLPLIKKAIKDFIKRNYE